MAEEKQSTEFEAVVQQVKKYIDPFNPEQKLIVNSPEFLFIQDSIDLEE